MDQLSMRRFELYKDSALVTGCDLPRDKTVGDAARAFLSAEEIRQHDVVSLQPALKNPDGTEWYSLRMGRWNEHGMAHVDYMLKVAA